MIPPDPPDVAGWSWWTGPDGDYIEAECYLCRQFGLIYQAGRTETATRADAERWIDAHQCAPTSSRSPTSCR